jgi:glycine cleavage system transcriptional repressor
MSLLAVTVLGRDRPGIIADSTAALTELGGNLEDSSMTLLRGQFAMTLVVRTDASADAVRAVLEPRFGSDGLAVYVGELDESAAVATAGNAYVLSVHGADRVGIVAAITGVLAEYGGNVTDLTTRLAGALYILVAEVELPSSADANALGGRLSDVAAELGVEVSLRPAETDFL